MSVSLYFGLPRSGKTTLIAKKILQNREKMNVYCNVPMDIDGYTYITNDMIGHYRMHDGLLLIDEGTLFANNRDYKKFGKELTDFFMLHGHYRLNIEVYAQTYNGVDKKIRDLCSHVYYLKKGKLLSNWSWYIPITYGIQIPDRHTLKTTGQSYGEIEEGYRKGGFIYNLINRRFIYRPKYYKYFNSWSEDLTLKELTEEKSNGNENTHTQT